MNHSDQFLETISAQVLQKLITALSFILPPILIISVALFFSETASQKPTISEYAYTPMMTVFIGIIFAIGITFYAYRGYSINNGPIPLSDDALANIAGTGAIIAALFPSNSCLENNGSFITYNMFQSNWVGIIHTTAAIILFCSMALFCLYYFTQSSQTHIRPSKQFRNRIYRFCGVLIIACIIFIIVFRFGFIREECTFVNRLSPYYFAEWIMIWSFSFAWAVKAGLFFHDGHHEEQKAA